MPSSKRALQHGDRMDQRFACVEAGAHQARHFARHAGEIDIGDRGFEAFERARPLRLGRRIGKVEQDLAALFAPPDSAAPDRARPMPLQSSDRTSNCASCRSARSRRHRRRSEDRLRSRDSLHAGSDWRWRRSRRHGRSAAPACRRGGSTFLPAASSSPRVTPVAVSMVASALPASMRRLAAGWNGSCPVPASIASPPVEYFESKYFGNKLRRLVFGKLKL